MAAHGLLRLFEQYIYICENAALYHRQLPVLSMIHLLIVQFHTYKMTQHIYTETILNPRQETYIAIYARHNQSKKRSHKSRK